MITQEQLAAIADKAAEAANAALHEQGITRTTRDAFASSVIEEYQKLMDAAMIEGMNQALQGAWDRLTPKQPADRASLQHELAESQRIIADLRNQVATWRENCERAEARAESLRKHIQGGFQAVEVSVGPDGFAEAVEKLEIAPPEGHHIATDEELDCLPAVPLKGCPLRGDWRPSNHDAGEQVGYGDRKTFLYALPNALTPEEKFLAFMRRCASDYKELTGKDYPLSTPPKATSTVKDVLP